jgi:RNA polymerase sigma factor (sigma-70 family)
MVRVESAPEKPARSVKRAVRLSYTAPRCDFSSVKPERRRKIGGAHPVTDPLPRNVRADRPSGQFEVALRPPHQVSIAGGDGVGPGHPRLALLAMQTTSLSLLARVQGQPDADSWQRLVDVYRPVLCGWLRGYATAAQDVDDLVQEVLAVVVKDLPRFRHAGHGGAFRGWLRGILVNRLRAFWRAKRGRPVATGDSDFHHLAEQLADAQSDLSRHWDEQHDRMVLAQLLELMEREFEPKTVQAFRRVALEGASPRDVAADLGMSVGAVYMAKSSVLLRLRHEAQGLIPEAT